MITKLLTIIIILFPINSVLGYIQSDPAEKIDAEKVVALTYNLHFDEAMQLTEKYMVRNPSALQWKYFHAMILMRKSSYTAHQLTVNSITDTTAINNIIKEAVEEFKEIIRAGENILKRNAEDTTALFYTGASYGYLGIYYTGISEFWKAASEGKKGMNYHDKLIELSPNWGDVYLSRGVFNYYASNVPWYLKPILWILGKSGTESSAVRYLKIVCEKGVYAKYEAMELMIQLFIRQGNTVAASDLIEKLVNELPDSKLFYLFKFARQLEKDNYLEESNLLYNMAIDYSKNRQLNNTENNETALMYLYLINNLSKQKNYKRVIMLGTELSNRKISHTNNDYNSWLNYLLGNAYYESGNSDNAKTYYSWIIKNSLIEKHISTAKRRLNN